LYRRRRTSPAERGIIIADTKFEFGTDAACNLVLIDEALTADSSRFCRWTNIARIEPASFDKQYVRGLSGTLAWTRRRLHRGCRPMCRQDVREVREAPQPSDRQKLGA